MSRLLSIPALRLLPSGNVLLFATILDSSPAVVDNHEEEFIAPRTLARCAHACRRSVFSTGARASMSLVQARAAQPCPAASHQIPPSIGSKSLHHGPHASCCALIGCLPRFSANAGAFNGPGKPFRARSTRRPSAYVAPTTGHQRCYCHCVHPRSGAQDRPGERLWPQSAASFLCTDTRLPALSLRPYSLRRGEATAHFMEYGTLDKTAIRERWSSTKTATIYIDEAVSTLAQITLTALQQATIDKYATFMIVPRSQHSNACGGRARFPCSGSCRQWRLQQC